MAEASAPADDELLEVLQPAFDCAIASLARRPYRYATSFALEEIEVRFEDGERVSLIFKDLAWERLLDDARHSKPPFLYEPRRGIETYRQILGPCDLGARCYAAVHDPERGREWLLLEKVPGIELWQVGELEVWEHVAAWLAAFHARFSGRTAELRERNPHLLDYSRELFALWPRRARRVLETSGDPRASDLGAALERYDAVVDALVHSPRTFLHGEFYPSNVLVVRHASLRVCPVDWEMAATGPGLLDLAALIGGWDMRSRERLVAAYREASTVAGLAPAGWSEMLADLDRCQLHLALQWLGWADGWQAPPEHAHDWIGEALELAGRLDL